ncbi:hypothetical protein ACP70R_012151 [Stipagrostis hirtigluma subsp. patula]
MAQISDVTHASAIIDAARQELAWAYSGIFTAVLQHLKGVVHKISEVLKEAEKRWVTSTREEAAVVIEEQEQEAIVEEEEEAAVVMEEEEAMVEKQEAIVEEEAAVVMEEEEAIEEEEEAVVVMEEAVVAEEVDPQPIGEPESQSVRDWLMQLKDVAYDMRAVAQKKLLEDGRNDDKLSARWLACLPRSTRATRITPTLDAVAEKLEGLWQEYERFGYTTGLPLAACTEQQCVGGQQETTITDVLVGRDNDKQWIIDLSDELRDSKYGIEGLTILPIFGPPCVGKTALVKSVFHDLRCQDYAKVWVDMLKGWDIDEIHTSMMKALGYTYCWERWNKRSLLLVLDGLEGLDYRDEQDRSMLDELKGFLYESRRHDIFTIVTTSSKTIAEYMSQRVEPYQLHPLSDNMCSEIIKQTSGIEARAAGNREAAPVVSEMIEREIASKCSGSPLAAKAIGRFLRSVNLQEWPVVRENPDIWNIRGGFSRDSQLPLHSISVFSHLKLSCHLGVESWLSFAYCAFVFPKGKASSMVWRDLLNQWYSLGITTHRGSSCIRKLLDRSLLLRKKSASPARVVADELAMWRRDRLEDVDEDAWRPMCISMHEDIEDALLTMADDLMHDVARYHLGDRLITVDGRNGASLPSSNVNKSSSACLALISNWEANKPLELSSILPAGILALRFEDCREMEVSDGAFAFAKYLRLLDLRGCSVKMLPDSIRHLKQLRYLNAPGIQDQVLPQPIVRLHELTCLILSGSYQLSDLTEAFGRLSNLLHLDLSGCSRLEALPESFGGLWRLEHLDLSGCSGIEALPASFCWLGYLTHLDLAGCSGLKVLPKQFERLCRLRHLNMSGCSGLQALPESLVLQELRHLDLSGSFGIVELPTGSEMRKLQNLRLSGLSGLIELPPSFSRLKELRHLDLSGCSGLKRLPDYDGWTKKLVHLNLSGCSRLRDVQFSEMRELSYLHMSGCSEIAELNYMGPLQKLVYLDMSDCSRLKELPKEFSFSSLVHLDLSGCSGLQALSTDNIMYLFSLEHLDLSGCSGLKELPDEICSRWRLKHLDLSGCSGLKELPEEEDSPMEQLVHLDLSGCSGLQKLPESFGPFRNLSEMIRPKEGQAHQKMLPSS